MVRKAVKGGKKSQLQHMRKTRERKKERRDPLLRPTLLLVSLFGVA
jgi:hypothetical protein